MCWPDPILGGDEEGTVGGDGEPGKFRDVRSGLGDDLEHRDAAAIGPHQLLECGALGIGAEVAAGNDQSVQEPVVDARLGEHRVVRQAAGGVVEGLGGGDRARCVVQVGGLVDHMDGVADSHAVGGVPELYAACTIACPPVATMRSAWRISSWVPEIDGAEIT